jgi:hypothetical protein
MIEGKKQDFISKITRAKRVRAMVQTVEHLTSKVLSSNSSTTEKKKRTLAN